MRRLILVLVLGIAVIGGTFHAQAAGLDRDVNGEDVTVSITSPFAELPPSGCVPYRVTIRNDRSAAGTWRLSAQGASNTASMGGFLFKTDLTVAPHASGSFDILVPLPVTTEMGGERLIIGVTGPGFNDSKVNNSFFGYVFSNHTHPPSPFTIIGKEVLGSGGTGSLETAYRDVKREFYGSEVDIANLPTEWRAYSGVAAFILKDTEWLGLNAAQRAAISDYVAQGGHLTLLTSGNLDSRTPELQLPTPDGKPGGYGFGTIFLESIPSFPPDADALKKTIQHDSAHSAMTVDGNFSRWGLRASVGTIAVSGAFILAFVLVFGSLVGPLNLFVFARGKNRFRLFWTTPLISILASLILVAAILVTDGVGGKGRQLIAVYSLPGAHREAVIQEQVARTAVLFSSQWHSDQDYLITPISEHALNEAVAPAGYRVYGLRSNPADSPDTYIQQENEFSGNWFRSRAISGQYLQAVRPSRASLTVLNPQAFDSGQAAPVVLSSFPEELDQVFLLDSHWHYWTCAHLGPGRKQTGVSCTGSDFNEFWNTACADAGGKLGPFLSRVRDRPGCFYATGMTSAGDRLATLGELHWQAAKGIFLGPWVAATASPENGP